MRRMFAFIVILGIVFSSTGCNVHKPEVLVSNMDVEEPDVTDITAENAIITDFAVRLFQQSLEEEKNTLIAPVSVLTALSMVANGADGNTLAEMEKVIGLPIEELNEYMYSYHHYLSETSDENNKLYLANSVWIKDDKDLIVHDSFLQANETYYDSAIYKTTFDNECVEIINDWISENTQGTIPKIIDKIPNDAIMYLINTLVYNGRWENSYTDIRNDDFEAIDGNIQRAEFMFSIEDFYLEDENAIGFLKYYMDEKYALVALLPKEEMSIYKYIDSLNGEYLQNLLSNPKNTKVYTSMPKFTSEYDVDMKGVLKSMGMRDAFDYYKADFSRLGHMKNKLIFLDRILHKTYIDVNENGTMAAVATVAETSAETSAPDYAVCLNRPFVYFLIDCENNIPLFIGTIMSVK